MKDTDIDFRDIAFAAPSFIGMLGLIAQRACGALLREIDCRRDTRKATAPREYAVRRDRDFNKVRTAFLENCDAKLAELRAA